jgi:hypothetical protein
MAVPTSASQPQGCSIVGVAVPDDEVADDQLVVAEVIEASRTPLESRLIIFEADVDPPGSGSSTYLARLFSGDGRPRLA